MKPYRNTPNVLSEVDAAAHWYEGRAIELGIQFVLAVEAAIEQVRKAPRTWPLWPGAPLELEARRFTMKRFPFSIAYLDEPGEIVVLSVAHMKRRPMYWLPAIPG